MNLYNSLDSWIKTHPRHAKLFLTTLVGTLVALWIILFAVPEDSWLVPTLSAAFLAIAVAWIVVVYNWRKFLVILLTLSFLLPEPAARAQTYRPPPMEQGGTGGGGCVGVIVGVIVILGGGGYITYRIRKWCQRKFPKNPPVPTNAPPTDLTFTLNAAAAGGYDAAALNFAPAGSCLGDACEDQVPDGAGGSGPSIGNATTFALTLRIDQSSEPNKLLCTPLAMSARKGSEAVQDWDGLVAEGRALGVAVTAEGNQFSFSRNGSPIPPDASPIRWDPVRQLVSVSRTPNCIVTIERSPNLRDWIEVLTTETEVGSVIQLDDTNPTAQMFYRYKALRD